ncbi:MAG: sigma 54-interacting transcriptional regulator [Syntrophobacteraceae bacterium]|nr:sigma 54-interacting transcriptional regulator [Syntrophobacteraceae bacterium]
MEHNPENRLTPTVLSDGEFHILKHIGDAVLITSRDGTVVYANDACCRIMGLPAEKFVRRKLAETEADSLTLKAMANRTEVVNVRKYVETLKRGVTCSVLLLPSPDDFACSVTIMNMVHQEAAEADFQARQRYVESCLDAGIARAADLPAPFDKLVGTSGPFRAALYLAYKASRADFSVLVTGESGVGKELLVRAIHESSRRSGLEFVSINCAAIPGTLIESELFGYASGSFTGGRKEGKKGLFDLADKGTLFFDEVGDFELNTQAKILRVLEEGEFRRVGDQKCIPVDTRILSATNRDLARMMLEGKFREDLYYRLNTMTIHVPPLRERGGDIELLAAHFLAALCRNYKRQVEFSRNTMDIFFAHPWPGNARELRSVVSYALNMCDADVIEPADLPHYLLISEGRAELDRRIPASGREPENLRPGLLYKTVMDAFEKDLIEAILKRYPSRTRAMEALGLSRRSFYLKLKKHSIS